MGVCCCTHPVGGVVELTSGEVGVVLAQNPTRRLQPRIAVVLLARAVLSLTTLAAMRDAKVTAQHPDWQLRIYGGGEKNAELRALVAELGLHNTVLMIGPHSPIEPEWAKGAIAAVTSDKESFGMTLVEAMRVGVPVANRRRPRGGKPT